MNEDERNTGRRDGMTGRHLVERQRVANDTEAVWLDRIGVSLRQMAEVYGEPAWMRQAREHLANESRVCSGRERLGE